MLDQASIPLLGEPLREALVATCLVVAATAAIVGDKEGNITREVRMLQSLSGHRRSMGLPQALHHLDRIPTSVQPMAVEAIWTPPIWASMISLWALLEAEAEEGDEAVGITRLREAVPAIMVPLEDLE